MQSSSPANPSRLLSRAVSNAQTVANTVDGFATSVVILDGQKELGSGQYYVEIRDNNGTWQFRLVDADGSAMRIASGSKLNSVLFLS